MEILDMSLRRMLCASLVLLSLTMVACSGDSGGGENGGGDDAPQTESKGVVGVSVLTLSNPFFKVIGDNLTEALEAEGYEVMVLSADEDEDKQYTQVQSFITQKCAAIVLTPKNADTIGSAIAAANEAGIPVFTCDTGCNDESVEVTGHVATDNHQGGRLAAEAMIEALGGHGKVAILHYPTTQSCQDRVAGFEEVLAEQKAADPSIDIEIVGSPNGEGKQEVSEEQTKILLQNHGDLAGLFCINDPSALGAVAALEQAGKLDDVVVIGFDGQMIGKLAILRGQIYADPIQFPDRMAQQTAQNIIDYFEGKEIDPSILIEPELYDQEDAQADPELKEST